MSISFSKIRRLLSLSLKNRELSQARQEIQIPMDLVTEILTRLPAKSLMRFKCVSKLWSSLIRSQYFSDRFLMVPSQQQRLYICLSDFRDCRNSAILSSSAPQATPSTFVVNNELTIPWVEEGPFYMVQNLCGLMCNSYSTMPRIYNPTTRQLVILPTPAIDSDSQAYARYYYFGHDPVNDQYKAICPDKIYPRSRRKSEFWVFNLKTGGSCKKAAPASVDFCPNIPDFETGVSINGVIYYMGLADGAYKYVVVSFDIGSEEFKTIKMPGIEGEIQSATLIDDGGKLTVFDYSHLTDEGEFVIWVLEDVENKEWSRKTLVLKPSQLHLVHNSFLKVRSTTQSGKVLLIRHGFLSHFYILCYDLQSNDMRKIDIKGIPDHWVSKKRHLSVELMFTDQSENILYLGDLN